MDQKRNMNKGLVFIRVCYYIGIGMDLLAFLPLAFPEAAKLAFGLKDINPDGNFLYVSRVGASLMLGWTLLLLWGSLKPLERRGILLITVFPVLLGLAVSSILAVTAGVIPVKSMLPLWIFYAIIIPAYSFAYILSGKMSCEKKDNDKY